MELHAIWNRIDQLEQLILSQAKEIDLLRRVVNTTQISLQNCATNDPCKKLANGCQLIPSQSQNRLGNPIATSSSHANLNELSQIVDKFAQQHQHEKQNVQKQQEPALMYKSYLMNPFVHPSIAIPPVVNRIVLRSENATPSASTATTVRPANYNNSLSRDSYGLNRIGGSAELNHIRPSRTLPANTRWSTGPSLLGTLRDDEPDIDDRPKSSRFTLAELITCFCPCFSMC